MQMGKCSVYPVYGKIPLYEYKNCFQHQKQICIWIGPVTVSYFFQIETFRLPNFLVLNMIVLNVYTECWLTFSQLFIFFL